MHSNLKCLWYSLLVLSWFFVAAVPTYADYNILQESASGTIGSISIGQTFTTIGSGYISQIDVRVDGRNNSEDTVQLCIYNGEQQPSDPAAAQYCQTVTGLPTRYDTTPSIQWVSIPLSSPFLVATNLQYTFGLIAPSYDFRLTGTTSDVYADGHIWPYSDDPFFKDLAFRVYIVEAEIADLFITKTDNLDQAMPGDTITYTITVGNNGSIEAAGASVADIFPTGLINVIYTAVASGGATGFTTAGSGDILDIVDMPVGSSITYTVVATIDQEASGILRNTASVTAPVDLLDPPVNNTATDETELIQPVAIPTISEWGMIFMSLMLAGSALWIIRRRQIT